MSVSSGIKNYKALTKQLEDMKKAPKAVLKATTSDVRKRVPGWVNTEVAKVYGVKKSEITSGALGSVKVTGDNIQEIKITYKGRVLTPTHFGMTPKAPGQNAYTLKAQILRGDKVVLGKVKKLTKKQRAALAKNFTRSGTKNSDHSPVMLMRANGGQYLPFQRKSTKRNDIVAVKTVSLPQMVSNERTHDLIQTAINEGLSKRLDHHMKRYGMK